jgi:hypothetical protein
MTGRVGEDPQACLALTSDASGAQGQQLFLCLVGVAHANFEMQLLRMGRVGPPRGNPFGDPLKSQLPSARSRAGDDPPVDVFIDPHPQHLAVELGESPGVRAFDHCLFEVSDHTDRISAPAAILPIADKIARRPRIGATNRHNENRKAQAPTDFPSTRKANLSIRLSSDPLPAEPPTAVAKLGIVEVLEPILQVTEKLVVRICH